MKLKIKVVDEELEFRDRKNYAPIFDHLIDLLNGSKLIELHTTHEYIDLFFPVLDCEIDFNLVKLLNEETK